MRARFFPLERADAERARDLLLDKPQLTARDATHAAVISAALDLS